jgi:hypothetical protein
MSRGRLKYTGELTKYEWHTPSGEDAIRNKTKAVGM